MISAITAAFGRGVTWKAKAYESRASRGTRCRSRRRRHRGIFGREQQRASTATATAASGAGNGRSARGQVRSHGGAVGGMVRGGMVAGDPIRGPYVVMAKGSGFMAAVLPEGMRAAAVDIAPDTSAGGFILPDDRVDVLLTRRDKDAEKQTGVEKYVSDTILRNIRVLAIDQTIDDKNSNKTLLGKTATLELTQPQAAMLSLSRLVGTCSFVL